MENRHTTALIGLLFVGVLMGALDLAIIGPALPAIQTEFGMNNRQLSVLFNAYVLCQIVGTPLLAKLSDRFGPRAIYIFSIGCFATGSLLLVMTSQPNWLFVGRGIQGFGIGGIFPVAAAVIGTELPREKRGPALGLIGAVFGVAFLLGPLLGGGLLQISRHWLFLINFPIAAVLIVGGVAASHGGGTADYQVAFVVMGIPAAAMVFVATRMKSKSAERGPADKGMAVQSA